MKVIRNMSQWREIRRDLDQSVGFVATMGALHDGHASLLARSRHTAEITVLSIYVNPTQFNDPQDLANYPDTLAEDLAVAEEHSVDYVILPSYEDIYADGFRYQVTENEFSSQLCGGNRPGHFTGVLTVVMKLLNLVQPRYAFFGEKDFQQYVLIRDMAAAFFMDVEIVACPTVRECDGLAMSSRNKLLSKSARVLAAKFNKALRSGTADSLVGEQLTELGFCVDYVVSRAGRRFGAVVVECGSHTVRLIDNVPLDHAQPANEMLLAQGDS